MTTEPGWYPDPLDPSRQRFWDGAMWADATRGTPGTTVPVPMPPPPPVAPMPPPPPPPRPARSGGGQGLLLGILALVAALILGGAAIAFAVSTTDDDPEETVGSSLPDTADPGATMTGDKGGEVAGGDAIGETTAPAVDCPPAANEPEVQRIWQDESGTHVVVVVHTTSAVDQLVNDPAAQFGLYVGADHLVAGTFDLSVQPLALPAGSTSGELELVFDAEADADPTVRARVFLPSSEATSEPLGFDLRYVVVCEPGDAGAATALAVTDAGADLTAASTVGGSGSDPSSPVGIEGGDDAAALRTLEEIHQAQAGLRADMTDLWVPQVSAKRLDDDATVDVITGQTIVHTPTVFLDRFRAWDSRYPGTAVLFRGSDAYSICGERRSPDCLDLWIVAIDAPQVDERAVFHGWCEDQRLNDVNGVRITDSTQLHCIARRFSAGPPSENSYAG